MTQTGVRVIGNRSKSTWHKIRGRSDHANDGICSKSTAIRVMLSSWAPPSALPDQRASSVRNAASTGVAARAIHLSNATRTREISPGAVEVPFTDRTPFVDRKGHMSGRPTFATTNSQIFSN